MSCDFVFQLNSCIHDHMMHEDTHRVVLSCDNVKVHYVSPSPPRKYKSNLGTELGSELDKIPD
ncbi:hypothetical protein Anas_13156 [Armadillidium nasatum]|uniref:Uncharacterized protein n=1 Tax=Armadillidium nasatum TaxID=96803 RepID=A0A5N5TP34_9CRUS|nr:hypothetical protein Anas_13156 [Armadillidium nasatum]